MNSPNKHRNIINSESILQIPILPSLITSSKVPDCLNMRNKAGITNLCAFETNFSYQRYWLKANLSMIQEIVHFENIKKSLFEIM